MAVVRITELPIATSAGLNDVFPFVAGGVTYQITTANLGQSLPLFPYTGSATISGSFTSIGNTSVVNLNTSNATILSLKSVNTDKFVFNLDSSGNPRLGIGNTPSVALDVSGSGIFRNNLTITGSTGTNTLLQVNNNVGSSSLFVSASNKVGIGTSNTDFGTLSILGTDNTTLSSTLWGSITGSGVVNTVYNQSSTTNSVAGVRLITSASVWNMYNVSTGASAGALTFGNGATGSGNERLRITNTGVTCFSCQVCTPLIIADTHRISTYAFDYVVYKEFQENTTNIPFFKVVDTIGIGSYSVFVNLISGNSQTGGYISQAYQGVLSYYFGGWQGSGVTISTIAGVTAGSSCISSAVVCTSCIVFRVNTSSNATATCNTTVAYIRVVSNGYVPTVSVI